MKIRKEEIIGLLTVFIITVFFSACTGGHETTSSQDTRPTVTAVLTKVNDKSVTGYSSLSGKIQAEKNVNVSARMMGYLTDVKVNVGDKVKKGQLLATVKSDEIRAKKAQAEAGIAEAKAGLENIEKDYERVNSLFDKKSATRKELDDITAAKNMMTAKLRQAEEMKNEVKTMLSYSKIIAPYSGIVTEKYVNSGDLATPGKPLFAIETGGKFQAEVMVPEHQITSIKRGDKVKVVLKNNDKEINGAVSEYSTSSLRTGGQYLAKIDLNREDLKDLKIYSGMYVNVLLPEKSNTDSKGKILVKKDAVIEQGQLTGIYTVSENKTALLRWIRLGKTYGDQVEVLSGLSFGENYISNYDGRLMNGVKVRVD